MKDSEPKALSEAQKKRQTLVVRSIWGVAMVTAFTSVILAGHIYVALMVILLESLAYREVINITSGGRTAEQPWGQTVSWYFLVIALFYLEGDVLFQFFQNVGIVDVLIEPMVSYHRLVSYTLYILGMVFFVLTLKPGHYREQYSQLCITHMALLLVVFQGHYIAQNVVLGLFWFLVPASLVIVNDSAAYFFGITVGKTPLISISPKKTVEGFMGGWLATMATAVLITKMARKSMYLICSMDTLGVSAFSDYTCTPNDVFIPKVWQIPSLLQTLTRLPATLTFPPVYFHVIALATFASLLAPFGGFFASGLKRALKVKDFGDTIPGHGGIVDRFDCQFVMGFFSYLYVQTFVVSSMAQSPVASLFDRAQHLSATERAELLALLTK